MAAAAKRRWALCYPAAVCAGLSRDLGVLVAGGVVLAALCVREWKRAALFLTAKMEHDRETLRMRTPCLSR